MAEWPPERQHSIKRRQWVSRRLLTVNERPYNAPTSRSSVSIMLPLRRPEQTPEGTRIKKRDHNKGTQQHTQASSNATDAPGSRRDSDLTEQTHVVELGSTVACHTTK